VPTEVRVVFNRIPELWARVDIGCREVLEHTVEAMEADAKSRLQPGSFGYKTGAARDSIKGVLTSQRTAELQGGGDTAPWFAYNEFGTRYRAAAPAIIPAFEKYKDDFGVKMGRLITDFK
jgi:hypothetical protein